MTTWQRRARMLVAAFAIAFAVVVLFAFRHHAPAPVPVSVPHTDPNAVVESTSGTVIRFNGTRQDVSVRFDKQLTYPDGSTRLIGVKIQTDERAGGRRFMVTAKAGQVAQNESSMTLDGDVRLVASDGMTAKAEHATYADADGMVRSAGVVDFSRGRMSGRGVGMTYDKNKDLLSILDQAVLHFEADEKGAGAAEITSGTATFARPDKHVRLERDVKVQRPSQQIEANAADARLSADETRIEMVQLRGNSRIASTAAAPGGLQGLTGRDMDLKYGADGETLEHALISGEARVQLAGESGAAGRQVAANTLDIALAPDGTTPTAIAGRGAVQLTFPPEQGSGARTIRADVLDAKGEPGRGLTSSRFTGNVEYRESGGENERIARSALLDVTLKPGMSAIDEARFAQSVRFVEGKMAATAASARYLLDAGRLDLTGSEPGAPTPHVVTEQIQVDATRIDLTLAGPKMKAAGSVKSVLQPAKKDGKDAGESKTPSLLKQDQPTNVTGDNLDYDGTVSKGVYTGGAQLWQGDTTIRGDTIVIDDKAGDLSASGSVATSVILEQVSADTKKKERIRSIGTAKDFYYQESLRRATYTTDAHLSGPQGDMTADKIDLYLKPSGSDELDHAEAFGSVTLRETARKTTGSHMTYFASDERYVVEGAPVKIVDECGQESQGKVVTFFKSNDLIILDGKNQMRAKTRGGNNACPGS